MLGAGPSHAVVRLRAGAVDGGMDVLRRAREGEPMIMRAVVQLIRYVHRAALPVVFRLNPFGTSKPLGVKIG
jgi:hypothetical protein